MTVSEGRAWVEAAIAAGYLKARWEPTRSVSSHVGVESVGGGVICELYAAPVPERVAELIVRARVLDGLDERAAESVDA